MKRFGFGKSVGPAFLAMGLIFLVFGLVQQNFSISFESGMFNLGVIFVLSGLVTIALEKRRAPK